MRRYFVLILALFLGVLAGNEPDGKLVGSEPDGKADLVESNKKVDLIEPSGGGKIVGCGDKKFDIKIASNVTIAEILASLSAQCHLTIIATDPATKEALNATPLGVNIAKMGIREILELLLGGSDLAYEINGSLIKISSQQTKTFKIDYISSIRSGRSAVSASIDNSPLAASGGSYGYYGDYDSQNANIKRDNQIESFDDFDFWSELSKELLMVMGEGAKEPVINKYAGLITITGTANELKRAQNYIDALSKRLAKQVFIDVSIIAVELNEGYNKGVDWSAFELGFNSYVGSDDKGNNLPSSIVYNKGESGNPAASLKGGVGGFIFGANMKFSLDGVLNFLSNSGNAQVISSPKIATLNNQPAQISVGDDIYYASTESFTNHGSASALVQQNKRQQSIFVGVLLNIVPQISDDNKIMMRINPSISELKFPEDNTKQQQTREVAPDTKQKKLSTVITANSGDTVVIGGLIAQNSTINNNEVAGASKIPVLGWLFKSEKNRDSRTELVFIITPYIVENGKVFEGLQTAIKNSDQ